MSGKRNIVASRSVDTSYVLCGLSHCDLQAHLYGVRPDRYDPGSRRFLRLLRHHGRERLPAHNLVRHP